MHMGLRSLIFYFYMLILHFKIFKLPIPMLKSVENDSMEEYKVYALCTFFLIFDLLYFCLIIFQTIEGLLSLGFDIFYYLSVLCFLTLTSLTVLCYIGYLVKKNGSEIFSV